MTKYHISYIGVFLTPSIHDEIIDVHPLDRVLISWNEIPVEIENQIEDLEKERERLSTERTLGRMKSDLEESSSKQSSARKTLKEMFIGR